MLLEAGRCLACAPLPPAGGGSTAALPGGAPASRGGCKHGGHGERWAPCQLVVAALLRWPAPGGYHLSHYCCSGFWSGESACLAGPATCWQLNCCWRSGPSDAASLKWLQVLTGARLSGFLSGVSSNGHVFVSGLLVHWAFGHSVCMGRGVMCAALTPASRGPALYASPLAPLAAYSVLYKIGTLRSSCAHSGLVPPHPNTPNKGLHGILLEFV